MSTWQLARETLADQLPEGKCSSGTRSAWAGPYSAFAGHPARQLPCMIATPTRPGQTGPSLGLVVCSSRAGRPVYSWK